MFNFRCKTADVRGFSRETTSRTAPTKLRNSVRIVDSRLGFTLIELLISIAIIATLSALFLGASRSAMEFARASRTKTTILKIHTLIMEQYASYETRRVDLYEPLVQTISSTFTDPQARGNAMADLRVLATRELMKFEMPDRWSDVDITANFGVKDANSRDRAAVFLESVPTITRSYYRRYDKAVAATTAAKVLENQRAECLYLTVMLMTGDGEARTMFSAQDIGDVDEDGLPEFLDGWGNPIQFLRWAPGFVVKSSLMSGDSDADHDPFDPFRRSSPNVISPPDTSFPPVMQKYIKSLRGQNSPMTPPVPLVPSVPWVGFRLVPLIFSGGPDGSSDYIVPKDLIVSDPSDGALNPYLVDKLDNSNFASGGPALEDGDESVDNITNHLQEGR